MSEEQIENVKKPIKNSVLVSLVIISLLMSIASLTMSILTYTGGVSTTKKVVISKQYDRGRSLEKAQKQQKPIIAFFYADWCGFCQNFAPIYDKVTKDKRIKKDFAIAYVNCENSENQAYVNEFNITGFPTVYVIDEQGHKVQLDNHMFAGDDAQDKIVDAALKALNK